MFRLGRHKAHRELVRAELGEGIGHFRLAANHAAEGVGAAVGPRVRAAREYVGPAALRAKKGWESTMVTVAPMAIAALDGARQARAVAQRATASRAGQMRPRAAQKKKSARGSRRPRLATLLVAGAAFGAAAAFARRRRNQPRWDEYDPAQALDAVRSEGTSAAGEAGTSPTDSITDSAKRAATTSTEKGGIAFTDTRSPGNRS